MVTKDDVREALHGVEDPELGMDIVELGLLYDADVIGTKVFVKYSLTSIGCPVGPLIEQQDDEFHLGVVPFDRSGDIFEQDGFSSAGWRHDQSPLAFPQGRDEVHDAG